MPEIATGRYVNERILEHGFITLSNLNGDRLTFYPRQPLPQFLRQWLEVPARKAALRDYLVNVGRGIVSQE